MKEVQLKGIPPSEKTATMNEVKVLQRSKSSGVRTRHLWHRNAVTILSGPKLRSLIRAVRHAGVIEFRDSFVTTERS